MKTNGIVLLAVLSLCGCGGGGSNAVTTAYDGKYEIAAIHLTRYDDYGGACGDARGTVTLANLRISGQATDTWWYTFDVYGSYDQDGNVTGGFAQSEYNLANFSGTVTNGGVWTDIYGCSGTWKMGKVG